MFFAFLAGFAAGALVVFATAVLAGMTPDEYIDIIKEERSKNGR